MLLLHPIALLTTFVCTVVLSISHHNGKPSFRSWISYAAFGIIIALINPLTSHRGQHILFYCWDQPVTLEASVYGVIIMLSLLSLLLLLSSYRQTITSDKFLYLFGSVWPKGSLLLVMCMRFMPLLASRVRQVSIIQRSRGLQFNGSIRKRMITGMTLLQIVLTWSLEDGLQTADSMKARGYGIGQRTSYTRFTFRAVDKMFITVLLLCAALFMVGWYRGFGTMSIYPKLQYHGFTWLDWISYAAYGLFAWLPMLYDWKEAWKWHSWK